MDHLGFDLNEPPVDSEGEEPDRDIYFDLNEGANWEEQPDRVFDLNELPSIDDGDGNIAIAGLGEAEQAVAEHGGLGEAEEAVIAHGVVADDLQFADGEFDDATEEHVALDEIETSESESDGDSAGVLNNGPVKRRKNHYSDDTKRAIYALLLERTRSGTLEHGVTISVAWETDVPRRVVQRVWQKGQLAGGIHGGVRRRVVGQKRVHLSPQAIRAVQLSSRTTIRDLAGALNLKKSTVFNRLKEGKIRRHTNDIKPSLTEENMRARVQYCLDNLQADTITHAPTFKENYNIIHIDEKWFYRTRRSEKFYLALDEERPQRSIRNKNYIDKVMFLAAQTRPRYDEDGNMVFDGKIGIFPFTQKVSAKRRSPNRPRGTLITKPITSITKEVSRYFLVNKVLPAIKEKWPVEDRGKPILIQQDNAKTHISINDEDFCRVASQDGFDIRLMCQPPNSPDTNVLDLGFFAAIQALFHNGTPGNIDDIVALVEKAYDDYPVDRENRIFLTHQSCLREIMRVKGSHHYAIPHLKKQMLERIGEPPRTLQCDPVVQEAIHFLSYNGPLYL